MGLYGKKSLGGWKGLYVCSISGARNLVLHAPRVGVQNCIAYKYIRIGDKKTYLQETKRERGLSFHLQNLGPRSQHTSSHSLHKK